MNVINYIEGKNTFWFLDQNTDCPACMRRVNTSAGRALAFRGSYPAAIVGLTAFKSRYPDGRATSSAMQQIQQIKKVPEELADLKLVEEHANLFRVPPYQHQKTAVEWMLHYDRLALLLEQGLGKTFITIMALRIFKEQGLGHKALVICPRIVFPGWQAEVSRFSDMVVLPFYGSPEERKEQRAKIMSESWDIVLTTFDMLSSRNTKQPQYVLMDMWRSLSQETQRDMVDKWVRLDIISAENREVLLGKKDSGKGSILSKVPVRHLPGAALREAEKASNNQLFLQSLEYDNLVVDEASRVINPTAKRSEAVEALSKQARRVYLLSGTLCVGRPTDMYMPFRILDNTILENRWHFFKKRYCVTAPSNENIIVGYRNVSQLKTRIDPFILQMERENCLDLPERVVTTRYYTLSPENKALYNRIVSATGVIKEFGKDLDVTLPMVRSNKLLQVLSGFLMPTVSRESVCDDCPCVSSCLVEGVYPGDSGCTNTEARELKTEPATFSSDKMILLEEDLEDCEREKIIIWAWYRYDLKNIAELLKKKKIPYITADAKDCARQFEENQNIRVFLGQTKQGIGITLNSATCTIYYSHGMDLESRLQSMDRNHRIGQTKSVIVKDYVCPGSVEQDVVLLLQHKKDVKDFMQASIKCFGCEHLTTCIEEDIKCMSRGCVYYKELLEAERKSSIRLQLLY